MKLYVRVLLITLCAAVILSAPFVLSAPKILGSVVADLDEMIPGEDEDDMLSGEDEEGWLNWLIPSARAEAEVVAEYSLPVDFTPGYEPNESLLTEDGYDDDSIRVEMETREVDGVTWRIAWVTIASPTQLRTGIAGTKVSSSAVKMVSSMAQDYNAVVAMNGDFYSNDPKKTTFEYRMGQKIRSKTNRKKDILIIDENGDFHTFIKSEGVMDFEKTTGHRIVNAFTFGPALVKEGQLLKMDTGYGYNPNGEEPRSAIGQLGPLSYVMVVAEGRHNGVDGVTHQQLADFMYSLNCVEAYNLDGGGSALLWYNGAYYNRKGGDERALSDIIYFATAVKPEE